MAYTEAYVSPAGAGAHDGSSPANAWTFEEAIAAPIAAGARANVLTGTHTLTAARTLPAGTTENPIEWRGYNSTIGDLDAVGRDASTGELITTNFPLIDCTAAYRLTTGSYNVLKCLNITSGLNAATLTLSTIKSNAWRVKSANTNTTGASVRAFAQGATNEASMTDCDGSIATSNDSGICFELGRGGVIGCRAWSAHATKHSIGIDASNNIAAPVLNCVVFHVVNGIRAGANNSLIIGNQWYDLTNGIQLLGDGYAVIANNIGWLHSGYAITGSASSGNPLIWNNAFGSYTSGRIDTGTVGSIIEEIHGITLTADPFTNSASRDFTLNNTAGGGALCRAASRLWTGEADLGAMQVAAVSGGAIGNGNLSGGFQ